MILITLLDGAYIPGLFELVFWAQNAQCRITQWHPYLACCLHAVTFSQERCHFHQEPSRWLCLVHHRLSGCRSSAAALGYHFFFLSQPRLTDHLVGCMPLLLSQKMTEEQKIGAEKEVFEDERKSLEVSVRMFICMCQIKWSIIAGVF